MPFRFRRRPSRRSVLEDCDLHDSLVGSHARLNGVRGQADVGDHCIVRNG